MELCRIFLCCLCAGTALAQNEAATATAATATANATAATAYEFKFRTCSYVKESNNVTVIREEKFHLCRLPVEQRANICKTALLEEFPEYQHIEYRDDVAWGEERLYEVFLNGLFYRGRRPPFIISACMCPTAPPMYMKDGTDGTYAKFYTDLHVGEDEFGFTKPWKKDASFGPMFNWDE